VKEMSGVVKQFMKEREKMDMQSDMMGDAMEDAFEDDDEMEGEDDILQDIMSEIVAEKSAGMATAPVMGVPAAAATADPVVSDAAQDELSARFENLRR
jgi:charged multivesicular body protein 2A